MAANDATSILFDFTALQMQCVEEVNRSQRDFNRVRNIMELDNNNVIESVTLCLTPSNECQIVVCGQTASTILALLKNKLEGSCIIYSRSR